MDDINKIRNSIDLIDKEIMSLLDKRFSLTGKIGDIKKSSEKPVLDTNREEVILLKTSKLKHSPQIYNIYKTIMNESKSQQRK